MRLVLVEIQEQVVEIKEKLVDAKEGTMALQEENLDLRRQLQLIDELEHDEDGNILWRIVQGQKRGPYCSTCNGNEKKQIPLNGDDPGSWNCPNCKNHFTTKQCRIDRRQLIKSFESGSCRN